MRFAIIAIGTAAALAVSPVQARDHQKNYPSVGSAIAAGCKVQQVHTPAGKPALVDPIVRCRTAKLTPAAEAGNPVTPSAPAY